jgi:hypothetical protein
MIQNFDNKIQTSSLNDLLATTENLRAEKISLEQINQSLRQQA